MALAARCSRWPDRSPGYTLVPIMAREANRVLVIDVSNSMAAADVGTSRLYAAKALAMRLARAQQGRVALVVFEAQPEVVSPLTTDSGRSGRAYRHAAARRDRRARLRHRQRHPRRVRLIESETGQKADLVILSDGEDQGVRGR